MRILKETASPKKTMRLTMDEEDFGKIRHLFEHHMKSQTRNWYKPAFPHEKGPKSLSFGHKGYKWTLWAAQFKKSDDTVWYQIFGTCGDSGFGGGWECRNPGNIRAARAVYGMFLKFIDEQPGTIAGLKFGI